MVTFGAHLKKNGWGGTRLVYLGISLEETRDIPVSFPHVASSTLREQDAAATTHGTHASTATSVFFFFRPNEVVACCVADEHHLFAVAGDVREAGRATKTGDFSCVVTMWVLRDLEVLGKLICRFSSHFLVRFGVLTPCLEAANTIGP